jgi:3-deoxy-manno-octulosonate cytidylyltransferase (CMP-KDO synthetase)
LIEDPSSLPSGRRALIAVIPARYGSSRFPGKPLATLVGKPMIAQVWARCIESGAFSRVIITTDDERIAAAVRDFAEVAITSRFCRTGMDRVADLANELPEAAVIFNIQGDQPAVHPASLGQLARAFEDSNLEMATLVRRLPEAERARATANPNVVKVVMASNQDALYFSRSALPFHRKLGAGLAEYEHLGLYGYRRATLLRLAALAPTPLECCEDLEQLRALESGIPIRCVLTEHDSVGVDTPADLARAELVLRARGS